MPVDDRLDSDETGAAETDVKAESPKKRLRLVIYIGIAVIMVTAGYFVGTKFLKGSDTDSAKSKTTEKKERKGRKSDEPTEMFMIESVIVNPAGTGGTRFLSVSIGFEVASRATVDLFEKREPVVKDALITILGSKTIEQLSDTKEKEITRYQIKRRVEQLLKIDDLAAVYFTDFILQ